MNKNRDVHLDITFNTSVTTHFDKKKIQRALILGPSQHTFNFFSLKSSIHVLTYFENIFGGFSLTN